MTRRLSVMLTCVGLLLLAGSSRPRAVPGLLADLVVSKTATPAVVSPGGNITYTVTFSNTGLGSAFNVTGVDVDPANTTFSGFTSITQGSASAGGGTTNISFGTIPAGGSATLIFSVLVNPATPLGTVISNTVTGATTSSETTTANNSATVTTVVVGAVPSIGVVFGILLAGALGVVAWFSLRRRPIA
jgi:uncharacterized repeat protein (TIGR01451 family)